MGHATTESPEVDVTADREVLYRDGIVALKGAFSRDWTERMREDMMTAFWEAIQRRRPGPAPLVRGNPSAGLQRLRRSLRPSLGRSDVQGRARSRIQNRGDRLRHPLRGRDEPALASRFPLAS
jgi:hypothetical protein